MRFSKKIISFFLSFALMLSAAPMTFATYNNYNDVPSSHWAKSIIAQWSGNGYGVLNGNGDGSFAPSRGLTLGELATILSKTFGYTEREFVAVDPSWADEYVEKAIAAGVIPKTPSIDAGVIVTREQAIKYITIAYNIEPVEGNTTFLDDSFIGVDYKPYVKAFQKLGFIVGKGNNDFDPQGQYTRAEAMQVVNNITSEIADKSVKSQTYDRSCIVRNSGVTVVDTTVRGNLIVGQGVGNGKVTLDNVTIKGLLVAYGGGANSIIVKGGEAVPSTVVNKTSGEPVHLIGDFDTITVKENSRAIITGTVKILVILGNAAVTLDKAMVSTIDIVGDNVKFIASKGSTVENVTVSANQAVISGDGVVKNVNVTDKTKNGVEVLTVPTKVTVDAKAGVGNTKSGMIQPGTTVTTSNQTAISHNNSGGSGSGINQEQEPILAINTAELTPLDNTNLIFMVENKLDSLSGTVTGHTSLSSMSMRILSNNLEVTNKSISPSSNWSFLNPPLLVGKNEVIVTVIDTNGRQVTKSIILVNANDENSNGIILDKNDGDSDGLLNYQETMYGTDKTKADTDDDGLSDYQEIFITNTNPLLVDSDGNGTSDGNEDFDSDGLINVAETRLDGNPFSFDTDFDGLNDKEESDLGSSLDNVDTDNDNLPDALETKYSMNPLNPDTLRDGTLDGERTFAVSATSNDILEDDSVKPIVELDLKGEQLETLSISKISKTDNFLSSDIPGFMGNAFDFSVDGDISSATIAFEFETPSTYSASSELEPRIYYFDEDKQLLEELPNQIVIGNKVSATVTHFSKYILLNKKDFDKVWEEEIIAHSKNVGTGEKPIDIVFCIDSTGSMSLNDPQGIRRTAAKNFVNKMGNNDQGLVIAFMGKAYLRAAFTHNKTTLNSAIDTIDDSGYSTSVYSGFSLALQQFSDYANTFSLITTGATITFDNIEEIINVHTDGSEDLLSSDSEKTSDFMEDIPALSTDEGVSVYATSSRDADRFVIILTDGQDNEGLTNYTSLIDDANDKGVKIFTIGLGSSVNINLLKNIAESTGGKYYHASVASDLTDIFDDLSGEISYEDLDRDGIWDYYEDKLKGVGIRLGNGTKIFTDIDAITGYDTDRDGLSDGQEIEMLLNADGKSVRYFVVKSDPTKADTDGDGIKDNADPEPMCYTITEKTLSLVAGLSYNNLGKYIGKTVGELIDSNFKFDNISEKNAELLRAAKIINANDSGKGYWKDFWDVGLGTVTIQIPRNNKKDAVIFALRGTEPDKDLLNDGSTDAILGLGWDSFQSKNAFNEYRAVASSKGETVDYFVTGHSLGGRLVQDVIYKTYNTNEGLLVWKNDISTPKHSTTFNGLGYNRGVFITLENNLLNQYKDKLTNYYYTYDLVGEGLGHTLSYKRAGNDVELRCKDANGNILREKNPWIRDSKFHGINYFYDDYDMQYPRCSWRD